MWRCAVLSSRPIEVGNLAIPHVWRVVQSIVARFGLALCIGALGWCAVLHVATFMTIVSFLWLLPPFFLMVGTVLCAKAGESDVRLRRPSGILRWLSIALLVYAILTFVYFYRTNGGASSVGFVNGKYVSMYKTRVLRTITEQQYRLFPNLLVRVMSAWIAMIAVFGLSQFPAMDRTASRDA